MQRKRRDPWEEDERERRSETWMKSWWRNGQRDGECVDIERVCVCEFVFMSERERKRVICFQ